MEYTDYEKLFMEVAEKGLRDPVDIITEQEWMLLSSVMKDLTINKIRQEIENVRVEPN